MSAAAAMVEGWEATRQKKRRKKHREEVEVAASSSESPRPPATPDSKTESPAPVTAETLTSTAVGTGKGRKRKKQVAAASSLVEEAAAATPSPSIPAAAAATAQILEMAAASSLVGEAVRKEEKRKGKRSKNEAAVAATPLPSIPAAAEGASGRKEQRRGKLVQGQSGQQPSPVDIHPQGGETVVDGGISGSKSVNRCSSGKPRVLTDKEILRERILWLKEHPHPLPQGFIPAMADPNSIDQDPKYSSPYGAFFDQFCYRPEHPRGRNASSLPKTPDPPARPPARDHLSFLPSQLTANQKAAKTTTLSRKRPPSVSASGSQEAVKAQEKKRPDEKMDTMKTEMANPNSIDQDPKYSSPFGPFFDQFCYIPERRQGCNAPSLPKTPDPPARPPPRDHPSFLSSQLSANQKAAKTTILNTKRPPSVSASGSQEVVKAKEKKRPDEKMDTMKTEMANPNSIDQDPKYSSPFGPFFDQFRYIPEHRRGCNAPSLPKTPDPPARPPTRDHPSFLSSQLSANQKAAKTTILNTKRAPSVSASGSQEVVKAKEKKRPDEKMDTMKTEMANPNSIDQDPKYSSPFGPFFDQFRYIPEHRRGRNAPSLPKTPDPPARPPPRDHPSFRPSQLTANQKAAKTTTLNTKRPPSVSASGSQKAVKAQKKKRPDEKMDTTKRARKKTPVLSAAEKRSDKYRHLPLNQLVPPPCSPHNLLQERYAHDPWKVIVICMLCNATRGNQVRKKLDGFFERYPDAQTACTADPEKMAEYLAPLGLQHCKTNRIQKMSKAYVEEEWTYITELFGVDKYAADAYAIFCAGRATEVVPDDHMLVFYWKYVCFELPAQASRNTEEAAGVTGQGNFAPAVQRISVSC